MAARSGATVLFLCTGNASRSVIAGAALSRRRPDLVVTTGGTLVLDGLPMSGRTRSALIEVDLEAPRHRSRQATESMLEAADLIVAAAPEHVAWVRREHREHVDRTATLIHLARTLSAARCPLADRIADLGLGEYKPRPDEEILDPGGGEVERYISVAKQIVALIDDVAERI